MKFKKSYLSTHFNLLFLGFDIRLVRRSLNSLFWLNVNLTFIFFWLRLNLSCWFLLKFLNNEHDKSYHEHTCNWQCHSKTLQPCNDLTRNNYTPKCLPHCMCGHQALSWRCDTNLHCNSDQSSPSTHQDASSCTDRNIDPPEFITAIIQQDNSDDREQGIL